MLNKLELYMEQERIYHTEGEQGVRNLEKIVGVLGYADINTFLADNSGAIEGIIGFIQDWTARNEEWSEALQAQLTKD
jgi:hypothetical protein